MSWMCKCSIKNCCFPISPAEDALREEKHLHYARGLEAAYEKVQREGAQIAFLLEPTTIEQVARRSPLAAG